jgi:hypothetical protein
MGPRSLHPTHKERDVDEPRAPDAGRGTLHLVRPGETLQLTARAAEAQVTITDRRLAVSVGDRAALDIPFERLRRIQFDIERRRPATLVIVPEDPADEPQMLSVPEAQYDEITAALAVIGHHLAEGDEGRESQGAGDVGDR